MKTIIYTAIYGGYDTLRDQPKQLLDTDYVCFSDSNVTSKAWSTNYLQLNESSDRMNAKFLKLQPHKVPGLKEADLLIWVDGTANILTEDFTLEIIKLLDDKDIMAFRHPEGRDCIYQEATYCKHMPKYMNQPIQEQVDHYRALEYPEHNGLYACGMMVYRLTPKLIEFLDRWWAENKTWTYQDQLSFPFLLWLLKKDFKVLELNQYNNHLIDFKGQHSHLL